MMSSQSLMPVISPINGVVDIPGSKYIANRAVMIAALAEGESYLQGMPRNNDIITALEQWQHLGAKVTATDAGEVRIVGTGGRVVLNDASHTIYTSASGTFSRFIAATLALSKQCISVTGDKKMNTRPMADLFDALRAMGASIESNEACLPAKIQGPLRGGCIQIPGNVSSQYISGLLIAAPYMLHDLELEVTGELVSEKYIAMTIDLMRHFGVEVQQDDRTYIVKSGQTYQARTLKIAADPVSSSYFMAAAALTGGQVTVPRFDADSLQGEAKFPQLLEKMGCEIVWLEDGIQVSGPDKLQGIEADLKTMPDIGQTLAILGACAEGTTRMTNISHLKFKESDRIADTAKELRKAGIDVSYDDNNMVITGGVPVGANIETHDDHRMAMSFSLLGLRVKEINILEPDVVAKSFPGFWEAMAALGVELRQPL